MTAADLMAYLQTVPPDAEVYVWQNGLRWGVTRVRADTYTSADGTLVIIVTLAHSGNEEKNRP